MSVHRKENKTQKTTEDFKYIRKERIMSSNLNFEDFVLHPTQDTVQGKASRDALRIYAKTLHNTQPETAEQINAEIDLIEYNIRNNITR